MNVGLLRWLLAGAAWAIAGPAFAQSKTEAAAPPDADSEAYDWSKSAPIEVDAGGDDASATPDASARNSPTSDAEQESYEEAEAAATQVSVIGRKRDLPRIAGSAHVIDEAQLERFEDDNVHRMLTRVPGVYVRGEDGYGLRPNIGMRGANSDRSKKVTLMEDGILFAPAPYSAPAAYYFPIVTRMTRVEVFKGPSAIQHGPNTIGGAINFLTRRIPYGHKLGTDVAFGTELYSKTHGYYGYGNDHWGIIVEGVRLRSNGFKDLDAPSDRFGDNPNTGFDKSEVMAKARINSAGTDLYTRADIKVGYSHEHSNETYLGLTDADFRANPYRRYAGSQLDEMEWDRTLIEVSQTLGWKTDFTLRTTAYRHDFHRAWFKLNRFAEGPELSAILDAPSGGQRAIFYDVLRGAQDSASPGEALLVGTNDRTFYAQGIQSSGRWDLPDVGPFMQRLRFGVRWHNDQIVRLHTEDSFQMRGGALVRDTTPRATTTDNTGSAVSVAAHVMDEVSVWRFVVAPGVRVEHITTDFNDPLNDLIITDTQRVLLPGVGLLYQAILPTPRRIGSDQPASTWELTFLAGVHQGFSPVSPGQGAAIQPEVSVNYEAGARGGNDVVNGELVGFFSDYSNLTGECTFSSGCAEQQIDDQFNGGQASIYGLEASATAEPKTRVGLSFPMNASYTFTHTEFRTGFTSDNPQWGDVLVGDELPYVPEHQFAVTLSAVLESVGGLSAGLTFMDEMREEAGQGDEGVFTDAHAVVDGSVYYWILRELQVYAKVENLFDNEYIVSRRPFGARPGRPRFFYMGLKVEFEER